MQRDDDVRASCFASLDVLCATFGGEVPYRGGLDRKFPFRGERVPFLSTQKGIFRAAVQARTRGSGDRRLPPESPYDDGEVETGFRYAYRAGSIDQPDNRALRAAHQLQVPLVYFVSSGRPGWYTPLYPCFVLEDDPVERNVVVSTGRMVGPLDERVPVPIENVLERRYAVRETRVRLHQRRFRGRVLVAYSDSCAISRLKELRLLDAAHIVGDTLPSGKPAVSNGLSLCSIHHAHSTSTWSGSRPTTRFTCRGGCWTMRTARCSSC